MHMLDDKEHLFALLAKGAAVITPNNRLSDSIIQQYFHQHQNKTVDKPLCLPYSVALINAYTQLSFQSPHILRPTLLNTAQCHHLWRRIIKDQSQITFSEGLLHSVLSAWDRCEQWQISADDPVFCYTPQTRQFQQWWQLFNKQLQESHLITEHQLVPYLTQEDNRLFPQHLIWVCFDDFTPQQQQLQQYLTGQGTEHYIYDLKARANSAKILAAADDKEEMQQLIQWLKEQIPGQQKIGIVVPDLQQKSAIMQRILARHFAPEQYNISLGQSLSDFPLVAHALCWLSLDGIRLSHHQATLLLQSPYISQAREEFLARSEYLQEAALLEEHNVPHTQFVHDLKYHAPQLSEVLAQIHPYPQEATVHEWIDLFTERLRILGFPGSKGLNSENYQCFNRFTQLFDELRQFSLLSPDLNKEDALLAFQYLADTTIFQAQKTHAPIQISGILEASGCEFDSLWVMRLNDQCLPQKVSLSAFIPPQLQRERAMPHSVPARELHFARITVQRLQNCANNVVFSYAQLEGDTPSLPCALITHLPKFEHVHLDTDNEQPLDLVQLEETYLVPLQPEETIAGGTALLANQAKCPFKAFAAHRLRAKAASLTVDGIDARAKGQLIHKVMELLWRTIGSQQALFTLDSAALEQHINQAIHTALSALKHYSDSIRDIESIRLKRIVYACLEWEKKRPPFTIAAIEESYQLNLAGLDFKVRVDRLDHVADKKWVIDYKSSMPTSKPWNEDRPKEPQLLLYALLDPQINALLFMQLKTGNMSCSGLSEEKQEIAGITSLKKEQSWEECRNTWQEQLILLAEEFQQGLCVPNPAQATLCQQCDFQNLCRFQG